MTASIATQRPNFHHITGTQPVGHTQIAVFGDYAGTVTKVRRINDQYWQVRVVPARGAFRGAGHTHGMTTLVWRDRDGSYVADYWPAWATDQPVEAARSWTLRAALGVAIGSAAERGHEAGLW